MPFRRTASVLLIGSALALGLAWWFARSGGPDAAKPSARSQDQDASPTAQVDADGAREVVSPVDPSLASAPAPAHPDGSLTIHFRARAEDGSWDQGEDGQAYVIWNPTHKWGQRGVEIRRGVGVLPPKEEKEAEREQLDFHFVRLGGRRARALERPIAHPAGAELTVDCEYLPSTELAVFDGPGQVHASDLVLAMAADFNESNVLVPIHRALSGPSGVLGTDLKSPITLEDRDGTITYFVRSPGSAWSRIAIDHETPGKRFVHLRPGGRVEFTVLASTIRPDTRLKIYEIGDFPGSTGIPTTICTLAPEGNTFIDGLHVGSWEVRAELGTASHESPVLGAQQFAVTAGGMTQVTLTLSEPPMAPQPVRVRGEIVLSEPVATAACMRDLRMFIQLIASDPWSPDFGAWKAVPHHELHPDPANPNKLLWDVGELTPGPWTAEIRRVAWCDRWVIEPQRENKFTIDLTGLHSVKVRVVDADTREPIPLGISELEQTNRSGCRMLSTSLQPNPADPIGELTLQAFEGTYELELSTKEGDARQFVHLPSLAQLGGQLEVEFSGKESASVSLSLRSSGTNIPTPMSWWRKIEFLGAGGQRISWTESTMGGSGFGANDPTQAEFKLPAEGPIEIRFPPVEEFLEIPPATVELVPGATQSLTIELVPVP